MFKVKVKKLFLAVFLLLIMTISLGLVIVNNINSAPSLKIIQDKDNLSLTLRKTIYVGEKMDWDVTLDGLTDNMAPQTVTWSIHQTKN